MQAGDSVVVSSLPAQDLPRPRLLWADCVRAICLIAIVLFHVPQIEVLATSTVKTFVYLWHLPTLFYLAGYLTPTQPRGVRATSVRCFYRLLVPYFSYVIVFAVAQVLWRFNAGNSRLAPQYLARTVLFGGRLLTGYLMPFWFAPVFAATKVLHSLLWSLCFGSVDSGAPRRITVVVYTVVAVTLRLLAHTTANPNPPPQVYLKPSDVTWMGLDICMYTLLLVHVGHMCHVWKWWIPRPKVSRRCITPRGVVLALAGVCTVATCVLLSLHIVILMLDLRVSVYGVPILTDVASLATVLTLVWAICWIRSNCGEVYDLGGATLAKGLTAISKAGLTIMFTHLLIVRSSVIDLLPRPLSTAIRPVLGLLLPVLLHRALQRHWLLQQLFLGGRS